MRTVDWTLTGQQKAGGLAALYLGAAYLLAIPFFLVVVDYLSVTDPAAKVALLVANHGSIQGMHLITYVFFGLALGGLVLALHERLKPVAPALMQAATLVGLLWAFVLVASGLIVNAGMGAVVTLYPSHPGQAVAMWQAIEPISEGLSSSDGEFLGGLWVLLVSIAALREGGLVKPLGWLGLAVGFVGIVSVVPPLRDAALAFGMMQIGWFMWLGIAMLRPTQRSEQGAVLAAEPA